jgi:TonB-dependent SusC/RagA subfamily outer membrane receptor
MAQQTGSVSGTVVDEQGSPIANARVVVPGTNFVTLTDAAGNFRIGGLPATGTITLRVMLIGFGPVTETVQIGTGGLRIQMNPAAISLDAFVITGTAAGVQEARSVGNSVSSIGVEALMEVAPVPDVSNLINARAPGVVVTPGTGQVGAGPTIRVRGASSFSLGTQPIIYLDGVRLDNAVGAGISVQAFGSGIVNRLNDINPEDIESIEIIKGPAAATLYGTEASNGVIQIITKRGRTGAPSFNLTTRQGATWFSNPEGRIPGTWGFDPVTGEPYEMNIQALEKERGNPPIFSTGRLQGYGASLRGGTDQVRYFVSADYDNDKGVEVSNRLWRLSTRANVTIAPDPSWDLTANVGYSQGRTNLACEAGCGGIWWATLFANANLRDDPDFRGFRSTPPEIIHNAIDWWQDNVRSQYSLQFNHRPWNWLAQRLTVGQDRVSEANVELAEQLDDTFAPFFSANFRQGFKFRQNRKVETTTVDYSLTATAPVSQSIRSSTTFGAQYYRSFVDLTVSQGNTFPAPGLTVVDALSETFGGEFFIENNTVGLFIQEQLSFGDRIFLTAAVRGDDNSAFGRDYDFVLYPKASATWVISEESFWNVGLINALKLRAAFGQAGQQPSAFAATRTYSPITGGGGVAALTPSVIGNDSLGPEKGTEFEVGFEAGLWNSRVGLDFTFYHSRTADAILLRELPPSLGFPGSQFVNAGKIRNQGFELQLTALAMQSENLSVDFALNLATNSNKILDLGGIDMGAGFIPAGSNRHNVGHPVGSWFRRDAVEATLVGTGYTAVAENPMCDGGDPNGILLPDGTPTELGGPLVPCDGAPRLYLGNPVPTFEGSFSTTVTLFKNLRLYAMVDWQGGHTKLDNNLRIRCQIFDQCRENYFPEEFDSGDIADMQSGSPLRSFVFVGAGFAKIRELSLSWSMPPGIASRIGAKRLALTVTGRNLHTFTNYTGLDPEAGFVEFGFTNLEQDNTPQLATFMTSISVTF